MTSNVREITDDRARGLAQALQEALIWWLIEEKSGPPYRVPSHIDGDLWKWTFCKSKGDAYKAIKSAVYRAAGSEF